MTDSRLQASRPASHVDSRDAAERLAADLTRAMDGLLEILETETRLVRAGRLTAAGALGAEKRERAAYYTELALAARDVLDEMGRLAPKATDALKRRHELFKADAHINLAVLATAREVAEDLVRSVAEDVGGRRAPAGYGRAGAPESALKTSARGIAVDRAM